MESLYQSLSPRFRDSTKEVMERLVEPEVRGKDGERVFNEHVAFLNSQKLILYAPFLYEIKSFSILALT